jgi:hypothetical protein
MSGAPADARPRAVLMCHAESRLNRDGIARWLASFADLAGLVIIEEGPEQGRLRIKREAKRIGWLRMADVAAFRLYYGLTQSKADEAWMTRTLDGLAQRFPDPPADVPVCRTPDPNTPEVAAFLARVAPDFMIARCKRILKPSIFEVPRQGTYVLHPGVCPEYRNAHGAFWALANDDLGKVGVTLLRIDKGVDTGPVYGYFTYDVDEVAESHIVVMTRLVTDNLDPIRDRLLDVLAGRAPRIDTTGRPSGVWGQPWLTKYLRWKRQARRRRASALARVP